MREIVFDTETTGLDPRNGDRLVEIGCIELVDRMATGNHYHAYFNPGRDMPAEAERVHGLSSTFLSNKPRFSEKAGELLDFLGDAPLVAHNASFDFGFLNMEFEAIGMEPISLDRMIDTYQIASRKHAGAKLSLDALCSRFGIDRSHRTKHGALLDAELLVQVYIELTGGRQIGLGLSADEKPADDQSKTLRPSFSEVRPMRSHAPSADELSRFDALIEKISEPLWKQREQKLPHMR